MSKEKKPKPGLVAAFNETMVLLEQAVEVFDLT